MKIPSYFENVRITESLTAKMDEEKYNVDIKCKYGIYCKRDFTSETIILSRLAKTRGREFKCQNLATDLQSHYYEPFRKITVSYNR